MCAGGAPGIADRGNLLPLLDQIALAHLQLVGVGITGFQAIADADTNSDSVIENWELAAVSVSELGYNLDDRIADNLEQYIAISLAQGIRVNEVGLCTILPLL